MNELVIVRKRETQKGRGSVRIEIHPWRHSPLRSVPTFTGHFFPHWFLWSHSSAQFNTHSKCPVRSRGQVCAGLYVGHWWCSDPIRQGLCLSWSSTGKSSQRRGQLREGVQGECGLGKQQGGVRKQREQAGEGLEAEGTVRVKGQKESGTFWGPESDGPAVTSGWPFLKRRRKAPAIKTDMKRKWGRGAEKGLCVHSVSRVEE